MAYEKENEAIKKISLDFYKNEMNVAKESVPLCSDIVANLDWQDIPKINKEFNLQDVIDLTIKMYQDINPMYAKYIIDGLKSGVISIDKSTKRSVTREKDGQLKSEIHLQDDLDSMYVLVHECAHYIANNRSPGGDSRLSEVESMFAERVFGEYAVKSGLITEEENKQYNLSHFQYARNTSQRVLDETKIYDLYMKYGKINDNLITDFMAQTGYDLATAQKRIGGTIHHYDPNSSGEQISNEIRFVSGDIIANNLFNVYQHDPETGLELYRNYIENKGSLSYKQSQDVLGYGNGKAAIDDYIEQGNVKISKGRTL